MYRGEPPAEFFSPKWAFSNNMNLQFLNLAARMQGGGGAAASTDDVWLDLSGDSAFIAAAAKQTTRDRNGPRGGTNANPKRDGYVFVSAQPQLPAFPHLKWRMLAGRRALRKRLLPPQHQGGLHRPREPHREKTEPEGVRDQVLPGVCSGVHLHVPAHLVHLRQVRQG